MRKENRITVKDRGFYNEHGGKKVCLLAAGAEVMCQKKDGMWIGRVEKNAWGETVNRLVEIHPEQVASVN